MLFENTNIRFNNGYVLKSEIYTKLLMKVVALLDLELPKEAKNTEVVSFILSEMADDVSSIPINLKVFLEKMRKGEL